VVDVTDDGDRRSEVARGPGTGQVVVGVLLIAAGVVWLGSRLDLFEVPPRLVLPIALVVVGVVVVARSFRGPSPGLVVFGVILSIVTILGAAGPFDALTAGVGDRTYRPTSVTDLEESYELGIGTLTLDLSDLRWEDVVDIEARVAVGELRVVLPEAAYDIAAEAGVGEVTLLGSRTDGIGPSKSARSGEFETAERRVVLDLAVFVGAVEVDR
jgi:predicted membrane protein